MGPYRRHLLSFAVDEGEEFFREFIRPLEVLLPYVVRNDLNAGAWGYGAILSAAGAGSVLASLIVSQRGPPRRYLTFAYGAWIVATLPFVGYAFGTAVWQLMAFAVVFGPERISHWPNTAKSTFRSIVIDDDALIRKLCLGQPRACWS